MFKKLLRVGNPNATTSFGLLIFRAGIALMMLTHGYPKFQRLLAGNLDFGDPIGLGSELSFILVVIAEFLCSVFLLLGLLSRYASLTLVINMVVIVFVAHGDDPFGRKEAAAMYLLSYFFLLITGPGKYSLDKKLFG